MTPIDIILGCIAIVSAIFGVIMWIRKPQEDIEKKQATDKIAVDDKAHLLAEQLKWNKEDNERRFEEMNKAICLANNTALNHIHSIDVRITNLTDTVNNMNNALSNNLTKLQTIIEERIPKKS